jgi:hypothetical protein
MGKCLGMKAGCRFGQGIHPASLEGYQAKIRGMGPFLGQHEWVVNRYFLGVVMEGAF